MNEVKTPKKPFIYYLIIAATIMILLNTLVFPNVLKHQVKEVGYNVFMQMTNNQEIGSVNITDSEIFFTNKDNSQMYRRDQRPGTGRPSVQSRCNFFHGDYRRNVSDRLSSARLCTANLYFCCTWQMAFQKDDEQDE